MAIPVEELREPAEDVADGVTALVSVTDEGLKGAAAGLERIADGVDAFREMVPLIAAAASAATSPLVEQLNGFRGADGVDGKDGADGSPGPAGPIGPLGKDGAPGADGADGQDGADGKDGVRGLAGKAGPRGPDGPLGAKGDKGLNWRGPFDGRVTYQPDDAIEFEGSSFVAIAPVRGVPPPDKGWELLARRGAQGASGLAGGGGRAPTPLSNDTPLVESGAGAPGTGGEASRDDHVHPLAPGAGGDLSYAHSQAVASAIWTINHNLGKRPAVAVVDSTGRLVIGQVDYPNANVVTVTFSAPFSGAAYLN